MRDIVAVIDDMKPYIENEELLRLLEKIQKDSFFKAPEMMWMLWDKMTDILNRYVTVPLNTDNEIKIVSIFTTLSEEEVRDKFTEEEI